MSLFLPEILINEYYNEQLNDDRKALFIKTFLKSKSFKIGGEKIFKTIVRNKEREEILDKFFCEIKNQELANFLVGDNIEILLRRSLKSKSKIMFLAVCRKIHHTEIQKYLIDPHESGEYLFNTNIFLSYLSDFLIKVFKKLCKYGIETSSKRLMIIFFLKKFSNFIIKNSRENLMAYFLTIIKNNKEFCFDITCFLMVLGFNVNSKYLGKYPLSICYNRKFFDIIDLLISNVSTITKISKKVKNCLRHHEELKDFTNCNIYRSLNFFKNIDSRHKFLKNLYFNSPKISRFFSDNFEDLDLEIFNRYFSIHDHRIDIDLIFTRSIKKEREDFIDFFISRKIKIKERDIKFAIISNNISILKKILAASKNIDFNKIEKTKNITELCLTEINREMLLILLQYGAKISIGEINEDIDPPYLYLLKAINNNLEKLEDFYEITRYFPFSDIQKSCDIFFKNSLPFTSSNKKPLRRQIINKFIEMGINIRNDISEDKYY